MKMANALGVLVALALLASAQMPASAAPGKTDRAVPGWHLGLPVQLNAIVPPAYGGDGPEGPSDSVPDMRVMLTSPVRSDLPHAPDRMIPYRGKERLLPAHMNTIEFFPKAQCPHDALGYFVVAGPEATADTVRVRDIDDPADSAPGSALAYAIRIGFVWVELTSHVVIDAGVAMRLLELVPFEYGGLMWAQWYGGPAPGALQRCND
ncbi:MAG: hypothetical protein JJU27_05810 [Gammaproteobacteria bacterium]|nr:hypothetical protein [Gammaproteobacteria bacterium]